MLTRCRNCNGINPELALPMGSAYCDCQDNPQYHRGARVSVLVDYNWLTDNGEYDVSDGWKEIEKELVKRIDRASPWPEVKLEFEEWEGEPEVQT